MVITVHAKRAEPLCNPCLFLKISQVSNQQERITLLFYQNVLETAVAISVANVVKVSIPSNKYRIKKRHPTRRMSLYLLKRSSSHPQHDISINMQFAANLTPYLQGRLTLSREVFAHSRRTDSKQLGPSHTYAT